LTDPSLNISGLQLDFSDAGQVPVAVLKDCWQIIQNPTSPCTSQP